MDEIIGDNVLNYSTAESSGTLDGSSVAADSTTALYATVNDAALIPDDIFGSCLQFAGEGENVELESTSMEAPLIQGLEKLTLSFWAFVGDTSPADGSVINAGNASSQSGFCGFNPENQTGNWCESSCVTGD